MTRRENGQRLCAEIIYRNIDNSQRHLLQRDVALLGHARERLPRRAQLRAADDGVREQTTTTAATTTASRLRFALAESLGRTAPLTLPSLRLWRRGGGQALSSDSSLLLWRW